MEKKIINIKNFGWLVILLISFSFGCSLFQSTPGSTPVKITATKELSTPTVLIPKATVQPTVAEKVPTKKPTEKKSPTIEPTIDNSNQMVEAWRIPPMEGAILLAYDKTPNLDPAWIEVVDKQARNLAIPKPYYFEFYTLPVGTPFTVFKKYYDEKISGIGLKRAYDFVDDKGIGVVTWTDPHVKSKKYLVQYIPGKKSEEPVSFIIYSNPEK